MRLTGCRLSSCINGGLTACKQEANGGRLSPLKFLQTSVLGAVQAMSVEEAKERRDRLARMRNLLFYHEQKAKLAKAIKSRDYHRHAKKAAKTKVGTGADLGNGSMNLSGHPCAFHSHWLDVACHEFRLMNQAGRRSAVCLLC